MLHSKCRKILQVLGAFSPWTPPGSFTVGLGTPRRVGGLHTSYTSILTLVAANFSQAHAPHLACGLMFTTSKQWQPSTSNDAGAGLLNLPIPPPYSDSQSSYVAYVHLRKRILISIFLI